MYYRLEFSREAVINNGPPPGKVHESPSRTSSTKGRLPADFIDGNIAEIEGADRQRKRKKKNYNPNSKSSTPD